jgi:hypothetical protein
MKKKEAETVREVEKSAVDAYLVQIAVNRKKGQRLVFREGERRRRERRHAIVFVAEDRRVNKGRRTRRERRTGPSVCSADSQGAQTFPPASKTTSAIFPTFGKLLSGAKAVFSPPKKKGGKR